MSLVLHRYTTEITYSESSGNAKHGLLQRRPDLLSEFNKVGFPLLGRLPLVLKGHGFVGTAGKFDQIKTGLFELLA